MHIIDAQILANRPIANGIFAMDLEAPILAQEARAGQFVDILVDEGWELLMRRPMSLAYARDGQVGLIYEIFGRGTQTMSEWHTGKMVNIIGPLGNGWTVKPDRYPVLIAGGVGIAPVQFLAEELRARGRKFTQIIGARTSSEHFYTHAPESGFLLTTDDGSLGIPGHVIEGLKKSQEVLDEDIALYGCGPPGMMAAMKAYAVDNGIPCQLAVEEIMACGIGLCQGCSVEMKTGANGGPSYRQRFKLACLDGPVFKADELA